METLAEYMKDKHPQGFKPNNPRTCHFGDFVEVWLKDDRAYSKQIDDRLTLHISMETEEVVGYQIRGLTRGEDSLLGLAHKLLGEQGEYEREKQDNLKRMYYSSPSVQGILPK